MATLDDLNEQQFAPLDINTPIVDRIGNPTPAFKQQQRSFRKVLIDQSKNTNAAIIQEGEVRAEADYANALLVDRVTAEAMGFTAAVMMKMEVGIAPDGVLARYSIVASLDPGGSLVTTGMYFDIVEDVLNPGEYLGEIMLDADRLKLGRADQAGSFPFYIDGGVVYIETAVIRNLSIGTSKIAQRTISDITTGEQVGEGDADDVYITQGVPVSDDVNQTGVLINFAAYMARPNVNTDNFGVWYLRLRRNGTTIKRTPDIFYDDNFAQPVVGLWEDKTPGIDPVYTIQGVLVSGLGYFLIRGGVAVFTLLKR